MAPSLCQRCKTSRALILRPRDHTRLCSPCFIAAFEEEIHHTISTQTLFREGETVAIGASGGKDSTVLAAALKTLNERYKYGITLVLLSVDEGITGYRDDSLDTVKRNAVQYEMPLHIVSYSDLYGWTMDEVVSTIGKKGNCTYCGVFRRQALDRGAAQLGINHLVTGHNADDIAETVLMNLLRGDLPRLSRATSITTESTSSAVKRSKPLKFCYEKEIVLYAHHRKLDYFSTECVYSPEAFRGNARALIKDLERIRPSSILDIVKSGEDMALNVPNEVSTNKAFAQPADEPALQGAMSSINASDANTMPKSTILRSQDKRNCAEQACENTTTCESPGCTSKIGSSDPRGLTQDRTSSALDFTSSKPSPKQRVGQCQRCGYMSSQAVCKACTLLEQLNRSRPSRPITIDDAESNGNATKSVATSDT